MWEQESRMLTSFLIWRSESRHWVKAAAAWRKSRGVAWQHDRSVGDLDLEIKKKPSALELFKEPIRTSASSFYAVIQPFSRRAV